jgi:hypothetical protein
MARLLEQRNALRGLTLAEVEALLGSPDWSPSGSCRMIYFLGAFPEDYMPIDPAILCIAADSVGQVTAARVIHA